MKDARLILDGLNEPLEEKPDVGANRDGRKCDFRNGIVEVIDGGHCGVVEPPVVHGVDGHDAEDDADDEQDGPDDSKIVLAEVANRR